MRLGSMRSPSAGLTAGSGPFFDSREGSTLLTPGERCQTTNSEPGKSAGRPATSCCRASMPPADAPTTTLSFLAMARRCKERARSGSLLDLVHHQDHAVALFRRRDERRAGDAAADLLAAAVDRVEHRLLGVGLAGQAGAHHRPQLAHRQPDV